MLVVSLLKTALVSILSGYLAFTTTLANGIETIFMQNVSDVAIVAAPIPESESTKESGLARIASRYEFGGAIPRILIENAAYQQAAVGAVLVSAPTATSSNTTIEERIAGSLVNVFCQYQSGDFIRTTTGTGFFIDQSGIVLTNAHVAQFLLLAHADTVTDAGCILRAGNPAEPKYEAKLLYISPAWLRENASQISAEHPSGTGERDYALLYVSGSLDSTPLPASFTSLPVDIALLPRSMEGVGVYAGGYPAEVLREGGIDSALPPAVATTTLRRLYTFGSNYADVFSILGSDVGEQGSSGGPIVSGDGHVIGLISTKGNDTDDGPRSLRALTLSYIDRTIVEETGFSLAETISGDPALRAYTFEQAIEPFLAKLLEEEFEQ